MNILVTTFQNSMLKMYICTCAYFIKAKPPSPYADVKP